MPSALFHRLRGFAIYAALFATGAAALVNQVVWQRYLARIAGADRISSAVTLAVFLGALAAGYALIGARSERWARPLRACALLELFIGGWSLLFPLLFTGVEKLTGGWSFAPPWGLLAGASFAALLLIAPPALLMGGSVPLVTRAAAGSANDSGSVHAWVYGVNTAGAVAGALGATYFLIPALGLSGSLRLSAAASLLSGAVIYFIGRFASGPLALPGSRESAEAVPYADGWRLSAGALASGAATLLLENQLMRWLAICAGGSVYLFALVVAAFVALLALGSLGVGKLRQVTPGRAAAFATFAAAMLLFYFPLLDDGPWASHLLRIAFAPGAPGFWLYQLAFFTALLLLLAPVVISLGAFLPALFHLTRTAPQFAGARAGRLLAWNAAGCLAGSLAGGVLLYGGLGLDGVYLIAPLLLAGAALLLAPHGKRGYALGIFCAAIGFMALRPAYNPERLAWSAFRLRRPLASTLQGPAAFYKQYLHGTQSVFIADGPLDRVAVMRNDPTPETGGRAALALMINGKPESGTQGDIETIRLTAHLPALLAGERKSALVIGLGTGGTAAEFCRYHEWRRVAVAEISPTVIRAQPLFSEWNGGREHDPRLEIRLQDGWMALRGTEHWDVISSEPSNPWVAGIDTLFSRDFYRRVRAHLAPGGLFMQWYHLYEANPEMVAMIGATLASEFPHLHAFQVSGQDILVLASDTPIDDQRWAKAAMVLANEPGAAAGLAELGIDDLAKLRAREIPGYDARIRLSRGPLHTLDQPRLQILAARGFYDGLGMTADRLGTPNPVPAPGASPAPSLPQTPHPSAARGVRQTDLPPEK